MTPIAGNVLGIANGGKTAIGVRPNGTNASDCPSVGIVKSLGSPPPFDDPGWETPDGAFPPVFEVIMLESNENENKAKAVAAKDATEGKGTSGTRAMLSAVTIGDAISTI